VIHPLALSCESQLKLTPLQFSISLEISTAGHSISMWPLAMAVLLLPLVAGAVIPDPAAVQNAVQFQLFSGHNFEDLCETANIGNVGTCHETICGSFFSVSMYTPITFPPSSSSSSSFFFAKKSRYPHFFLHSSNNAGSDYFHLSLELNVPQSFFNRGIHWFATNGVQGTGSLECMGLRIISPLSNSLDGDCISFAPPSPAGLGFGLTTDGLCDGDCSTGSPVKA
jgi:hypothetical protein